MSEDRIKELFANEEFVKELFESKSYEEAQAKLTTNNVEVSIEELKKAYELIQKKQSGELSDEELKDVAGGFGFGLIAISITGSLALTGALAYSRAKDKC